MKPRFSKIVIFIIFVFLTASGLPGLQAKRLSEDINTLYQRIYKRIPSTDKDKVLLAVKSFEQQISSLEREHNYNMLAEKTIRNFLSADLSGMDVSEAAFIVMMMATKDMDDDIRLIMQEIKAMTAAKQKLRELIKELNAWISEEMNNSAEESEDIDLDKVSQQRDGSSQIKINPEIGITPNYKVKYFKTPVIKRILNIKRMPFNELKRKVKQMDEDLKALIEMNEALRLIFHLLSERQTKLIQIILNLSKKISRST